MQVIIWLAATEAKFKRQLKLYFPLFSVKKIFSSGEMCDIFLTFSKRFSPLKLSQNEHHQIALRRQSDWHGQTFYYYWIIKHFRFHSFISVRFYREAIFYLIKRLCLRYVKQKCVPHYQSVVGTVACTKVWHRHINLMLEVHIHTAAE